MIRRRPRLLLGFLFDVVIIMGLYLAVLAAIGKLDSFGSWAFVVAAPTGGRLYARVRAAHQELHYFNGAQQGAFGRLPVRKEDQITVTDLVRAYKR